MNIDERVYGYEPARSQLTTLRAERDTLRKALVHAREWISKAGHMNSCEWYANYDSAMCTCGRLRVYDAAIDAALAAQEQKP